MSALRGALLICICLLASEALAQSDRLLIDEFLVEPEHGFVELVNDGTEALSLEGYYLANHADYARVVRSEMAAMDGAFVVKLPATRVLAPGERWALAVRDASAFEREYLRGADAALTGTELSPWIEPAFEGAIDRKQWRAASGVLVLFWWDGASDLVSDVDIVCWGSLGPFVDKTGLSIDGPDEDELESAYAADQSPAQQWRLGTPAGLSYVRIADEWGESSPGNGVGGQDELSEAWPRSFARSTSSTPMFPNLLTRTLSGRLLLDGEASQSGQVQLPSLALSVGTDQQGRFLFEAVPQGVYTLTWSDAGEQGAHTVQIERNDVHIELEGSRSRRLQGRVLLEGLAAPEHAGTRIELSSTAQAVSTDGDGDFVLPGVFLDRDSSLELSHPGYRSISVAASEALGSGFERSLRRELLIDVEILILSGAPSGSIVTLSSELDESSYGALLTRDGPQTVLIRGVRSGRYTLMLSAAGFLDYRREGLELGEQRAVELRLEAMPEGSKTPELRCQATVAPKAQTGLCFFPLLVLCVLLLRGTAAARCLSASTARRSADTAAE
ncbi:MAG: carboxypeptidase-like regulatory domain-containing protein [Myxococcota bacterium]|nr:carboxypeptidase-like regulatory domain-containing protein [Myxococcota bacterium]